MPHQNPDVPWLDESLPMPDPPPPLPRAAPRALRVVARVALWGLVALAALGTLRGAVPARPGPPAAARPDDGHGAAAGVAAAFLREYLTAGDGQAERHARLAPFLAAGVDLDDAVRVGPGEAQYVDQVLPAGARPTGGTLEVTVLAHVLEVRAGRYRHGGTLAFAVPVAAGPGGFGVRGTPRPAALPVGTLAVASRVAPPPGSGGRRARWRSRRSRRCSRATGTAWTVSAVASSPRRARCLPAGVPVGRPATGSPGTRTPWWPRCSCARARQPAAPRTWSPSPSGSRRVRGVWWCGGWTPVVRFRDALAGLAGSWAVARWQSVAGGTLGRPRGCAADP